MEGNAKIIKMIARDEALHLVGTQHMLNLMGSDPRQWVNALFKYGFKS
jgi:ribonucleotide reductase beta subunit family protein with ferritin-like domain